MKTKVVKVYFRVEEEFYVSGRGIENPHCRSHGTFLTFSIARKNKKSINLIDPSLELRIVKIVETAMIDQKDLDVRANNKRRFEMLKKERNILTNRIVFHTTPDRQWAAECRAYIEYGESEMDAVIKICKRLQIPFKFNI